jgi:H+/Na+-translocating ferredoxin:NAD+ oxidoreductase subunit G
MNKTPVLLAALVLSGFAIAGVTLVAVTHAALDERILQNARSAMQRKLAAIVPQGQFDNDPLTDRILVSSPELLGTAETQVYRVRRGVEPVALILNPVVPNGYAGPIELLVSVLHDGTVGGVRVLSHHETPGLGDRIEEAKSDWVLNFDGKSLGQPPSEEWGVKRDGGAFDQFTGATITPRAIVAAVKNTLLFVQSRGEQLYSEPVVATGPAGKGKT